MLHKLEIEALKDIVKSAGADEKKAESVIDERLSFAQNKLVIKQWLTAEGKAVSLKTEFVAEKELESKMADAIMQEVSDREANQYQAVCGKKKEINDAILRDRKRIINEIEAYNPHMSSVTYSTLFAVMNARQGKQKTNVINMGKQGIGKTRGTSDLLTKLEIPDAVIVKGFMTPRKVYDTIKQNFFATICFDEADCIFNDEMSMFILRPAMFGGHVSWLTSRGDVADSFEFTGTVIANMNHFGVKEASAAPLFDRTLFNGTNLDNKQLVSKMQSAKEYVMNNEIWSLIKNKITLARNEGISELENDEEKYVMDYIVEIASGTSIFNKSLSARARGRALLVARCLKTIYIEFDDVIKELFKKLAKPYIATDDADDLTVKVLKSNPNLTRAELADVIAEQKQMSVRNANRLIKAAIDKGLLISINRTKIEINNGQQPAATNGGVQA